MSESEPRKKGRPPAKPGTKRVLIAARVSPETKQYLDEEQARTRQSLGVVLDEATRVHREIMR